jgi:hypothetical protein
LDVNGDGLISREEFEVAGTLEPHPPPELAVTGCCSRL